MYVRNYAFPPEYHGQLMPENVPERKPEESGEQPPENISRKGILPSVSEETLLLCAVGFLLFSGQSGNGWQEEDLALLLILLLLIT